MTRLFAIKWCSTGHKTAWKNKAAILSLALMIIAGCGKKGPPLPPLIAVPEAVQSFDIEGREEGLLLSWQIPEKNSADLAGFKLHRQSEAEGCHTCPSRFPVYKDIDIDLLQTATIKDGSLYFMDSEVKEGVSYRYKVVPYSRSGYLGPFSPAVIARWNEPPPPPTGVKAEPGDRSVRISWFEPNEASPASYRIYRSNTSQHYERTAVNKRPLEAASYADIGLENNRQYYYVVKALIREGATLIEGPPSAEVLAVPVDLLPPASPSSLRAVPSSNKVHLSWDITESSDVAGYFIYRRKQGELAMERLTPDPVNANYYIDNNVLPEETYYYDLTAVDNSPQKNESDPSGTVEVRIPAL